MAAMGGKLAMMPQNSSDHQHRLQILCSDISSKHQLDPDVRELLLELAKEFVDSSTAFACKLAEHRDSKEKTVEVKDLMFHLEKNWDLRIPGYNAHAPKRAAEIPTEDHEKRSKLIKAATADTARNARGAIKRKKT